MSIRADSIAGTAPATDATKFATLLSLAAGAIALPQTGQADIIYTDLTASPVTVNYSTAPFFFTVPGTAQIGLIGKQRTLTTTVASLITYKIRSVLAGVPNSLGAPAGVGGNPSGAVVHLPAGATWNQPPNILYSATIGFASDGGAVSPNTGYNNRYFAWRFYDDSPSVLAYRFGWAEYNLSVAGYNAGGPTVTLLRYAYDNTGAKPTMGQMPVPEPTTGALTALGAMALGARGLRQWRDKSQSAAKA